MQSTRILPREVFLNFDWVTEGGQKVKEICSQTYSCQEKEQNPNHKTCREDMLIATWGAGGLQLRVAGRFN